MQTSLSKSESQILRLKYKRLDLLIALTCCLGVLICMYSLRVEFYKEKDKNYVAFCDISSYISCSKVLTSK